MSAQQPPQPDKMKQPLASTATATPFEIDSITDYMAPFLPPQQAALASLSLSASLLHSPSPAHLLASSYLLQRKRHYTTSAFAQLLTSLAHSTTLYIGNLSFTTREEQLLAAFHLPSLSYPAALHMGLNSLTKQPCGFAFATFASPATAHTTRAILHTLAVDERTVGIDLDQHFKPGREWGRGKSGGQIRDEVRQGWDKGRGGWGARERRQQQAREMKEQQVSTFKQMGGDRGQAEQIEGGEEEAASGQQQRGKREHGSYAHAQAMRRAGAQQNKAVELGAEEETEDRVNKRQKLEGDETKQPYNESEQQLTEAAGDDYGDDGRRMNDDGGGGASGAYWAEGGENNLEQKEGEDVEASELPSQQDEEEEAEHGFAGGAEDSDEPQWT